MAHVLMPEALTIPEVVISEIPKDLLVEMAENIGYIKGRIETLPALDDRVRSLEKKWWQFPAAAAAALVGVFGRAHGIG